jgi:hypothetical protein
MARCKYKKICKYYQEDSRTCNSSFMFDGFPDRNYCGKYREFEELKNEK